MTFAFFSVGRAPSLDELGALNARQEVSWTGVLLSDLLPEAEDCRHDGDEGQEDAEPE